MNILLTIASVAGFLLIIVSSIINFRRRRAVFRMQKNIEQFEIYLIKNREVKSSNIFKLLESLKFVANNPEFLDIQVLLMSKVVAEDKGNLFKDTKWFEETLDSLTGELKSIYDEFNYNSDHVIRLSPYKFDFIMFAFIVITRSVFEHGFHAISKIIKEYKFIINNDEAIIYSGRLATA